MTFKTFSKDNITVRFMHNHKILYLNNDNYHIFTSKKIEFYIDYGRFFMCSVVNMNIIKRL